MNSKKVAFTVKTGALWFYIHWNSLGYVFNSLTKNRGFRPWFDSIITPCKKQDAGAHLMLKSFKSPPGEFKKNLTNR